MLRAVPIALLFSVLHGGCGGQGSDNADRDCAGFECRSQQVLTLLDEDPGAAPEALSGLDPVEQMLMVDLVIEGAPTQLSALCQSLPPGQASERCKSSQKRPHLWQVGVGDDSDLYEVNDLQVTAEFVARHPRESPFGELGATTAPCSDARLQDSCQATAATLEASSQNIELAAALCNGIEDARRRGECFFSAVDVALKTRGGSLEETVGLCDASGVFVPRCLGHIVWTIASGAPAADVDEPARWREVNARIGALGLAIGGPLGAVLQDRAWAETAYSSLLRARTTGVPEQGSLATAAVPHFRMALALREVEDYAGPPRPLDQWAEAVQAAARVPVGAGTRRARAEHRNVPNTWTEVRDGEHDIRWVIVLADGRRALAETPEADAAICVLEALDRVPRADREPLVMEGLQHPHELVRWTAARVLEGHPDWARPERDEPSALVRARLDGAEGVFGWLERD